MSGNTKYCHQHNEQPIEATKMLEIALQQMDGIIASTQMELASLPDRSLSPSVDVLLICEKLKYIIQNHKEESELNDLDEDTKDILIQWLTEGEMKDMEERICQLEGDKESLQLQVSVLSEQVEAQTEKMIDLETLLEHKHIQLLKTEDYFQRELMARSSLETQKLELLNEIANLKLYQTAFERENADLRDKIHLINRTSKDSSKKQCIVSPVGFSPNAASTPLQPSRNDVPEGKQTPPSHLHRKVNHYGTMPRQQREGLHSPAENNCLGSLCGTTGRVPKGVMFGKGNLLKEPGKRSTSAPNLAETEKNSTEDSNNAAFHSKTKKNSRKKSPTSINRKSSGLKKILTRLRRSSSDQIDNELGDPGELKRGGLRATATARLGWTSNSGLYKEPLVPFSSWSSKHVEEWLSNLGLSQYMAAAKGWMSTKGNHISAITAHKLEKELGVRHPIHRKKLQLAILTRVESSNSLNLACSKLNTAWVLRWLDDVALPQYKDVFSEARVDGLVLNYLTYDDLCFLKITNLLHATSIKRGIQVLREHNFNPSILKRRSTPDDTKKAITGAEVALWTNHRVMEWLKTVDLSEYAPNLRGSGVHGALLVYEAQFTSEFLASLLSISPSKTLLRRHLNTHFKELVGVQVVQSKREFIESSPNAVVLSTFAKLKMPRKSQFSLKRKKAKNEIELDDLLCVFDDLSPRLSSPDTISESPGDYH